MQKRKSFFNNELEQRFSLRKYTIGLCSVCLGFVVIGMGSQSVKADTVNDVGKSPVVQENKAQETNSTNTDALAESKTNTSDSVVAKPNITPTETKKNEAGSVAMAEPKTADSNNSASVNTSDQSKSENSSAVAPTSEKTQLQTSQDSSIKSKENSLNNKSNANTPVTNKASHESNSQAQPSSSIDHTPTKLVRLPVMRLAATAATNSDELIVGKDVTISDFSVTTANGRNEFENSHANIKFTMHTDDPSAIVDKRLTIQVDKKVWDGFYFSEQQGSNPATISYQGQVIGTLNYGYPFNFVYITFDNHVKDYTSINLQSDLVMAGNSQNDSLYQTDLYTPTQSKDGQTYHLTNDIVIGQQKYSSNLPSTIHYRKLGSESVSSVTDVTTTSYTQRDSKLYAGMFYKTPDGIYYSQSSDYSGNNLYGTKIGQPGYLEGSDLYVGTDIITDHTQSYTATIDIDQTKLSPDHYSKTKPIASYYLNKNYWDDKNLLLNTSDVYIDSSHTYSSTATADATVTKNSVIFNKLNGQSLSTRRFTIDDPTYHMSSGRYSNYINQHGKLHFTPALFKQLQAAAESDQNLTEAINTVKTTGRNAEIKLVNPINTGLKATIKTSDGKTKEVSLLIDTIDYEITTASTAPKGSILVSAQGKTAKIYHPGDQNIPAVVDQNKLTKTITRTINVHEPGESVTTIKQDVVMTQSVSVVDGKDVTYNGDWKVQGDSYWASYDTPVVPGYTANYSHVASQSVSDTTENQTIEITYTANSQTTHVNYVDAQGNLIHTTTVNGHTNQTVDVPSEVPAGWKLVDGQTVPNTIAFGPDGHADTSVKIEHRHVTVIPDRPQTNGTKLPDNPKQSFHGVEASDLNKTVTRTIKVTTPDGQTKTFEQTAKLTRTADVDEVTGEVKYSNWTTDEWTNYVAPSVPGYTASQPNIADQTVTDTTKDQTVNITYTANDHQISVEYVDNATGQVLKTDHVSGKTGQTVPITPHIPDGWELVSGQSVPSEVTLGADGAPTTVIKVQPQERSVSVKFVDDQSLDWGTTYTNKQVGQAVTLTGRDGETVDLHLTVPDKYQLADGQQLPTTYTFAKGSGDLKIHLVHKVVQREATADVQMGLVAAVRIDDGYPPFAVTQNQWTQLDDKIRDDGQPNSKMYPLVKVGILTGHVNYDLVDNQVVSFGDDWTTLNLGGQTYQMPDGTEVVNGIFIDYGPGSLGKSIKEELLKYHPDTDPDYANRPWHGYLSVNATNKLLSDVTGDIVQSGLVGNEPNTMAKANGDQAATAVKSANKTIDLSLLQHFDFETRDFSEQNGRLQGIAELKVAGVYVPYVEKTATRTINVTTPDGKTSAVKQTATLAKQVDFSKDAHPAWTTGEWANYDVPTIPGYTASQRQVAKETVTGTTEDQTVNITYTANDGTQTIVYQDEDGSEIGKQVISGKTDEKVKVTPDVPDGYVLKGEVPSEVTIKPDDTPITVTVKHGKSHVTPDKPVNKGDLIPDTKDKHYPEGLTHNDLNKTVTREVTITDPTGKKSTTTQTVTFTRGATVDEVTNEVTYDAWSENGKHTFDKVDVPIVQGYTASGDVPSLTVTPDSQLTNVTVIYNANEQTAKITYIDDTTKTNLDSKDTSGKFGQVITFATSPADEIENYKKQGYVLVSSTFDNNKYQADNSSNVFYVHLRHGTKDVSRTDDVNMTVHYVMDDNSEAPSDNKQTLSFTENGIQDLVTKHIDWTPAVSQTFKDVVTPKVAGYTPDQDNVAGQTFNFGDNDVEVTVTYSPNVQLGHINYIDDNTGKTLTRDDFSGRTNEHEDYTSTDRIQEFENKGYELVSNDYPDGGFNFDNNDRQDQVFNVHFKHGIVTVTSKNPQIPNTPINPDPHSPKYPEDINNTNSDVKRTIDYKFKDDKTAQPTVTDNLHFERTVVIDKVTGDVLSDIWTPSQNFSDIQTPAIQGYTPDRTVVSDKNIGHDHQDIIEHVVYSPDAQHMTITYIDDTTGKTLHTDNPTGVSDQDAKYTTSDTIKQYEEQHYKLVSDSTKGKDLIFDHDDDADQTYEVHFVHEKHAIDQTTSPKQTIHYVYADGLARQGKAADDNVQQLSFKRDGYNDEVTGIDHWNAWTSVNSNYNAVDSPVIQGYTPNKSSVDGSTVNPTDKDTEITVVYNADKQAARVIYVDKTTNTTLVSKDLSGKSDEDSEYNTKDTIGQYKSQHYVLTGDETNGNNVIFDHDDQQDQTYYVYFVHDTQKVRRQSAVTSTINYKFEDGKTAQPTVTQTKYFSEDGVKDLVTNKITWDEVESQKFDDIATKSIVGYTPDKDNVTGSTVNFGDSDIEVTVTYHNNAQKAVITYVDDVTKKTLASDSQDGKFDHEITFKHDPAEVINSLKEKGYKLVSNDFKDGTKYKADDKQNEFIVHLTHDKQKVNRQDQVVETIHYVYENGSKSQPDHEQTISFTEDGVKDKVTGQITWTPADSQKFDDVATPVITGYTPDKNSVAGSTVKFGDSDIEVTVTYHNNAQTAKITYIDDTAKKTLDSDTQNGKFNHVITFEHDPAEVINSLKEKGYKLVSNDFNNNNYQADNSKNVFYVHFVHGSHAISDKKAITETVTYKMSDNSKAPDKVEKQVEFNRVGKHDEVTNTDTWNKWQPDKQSFSEVPTPEVTGYTPDIKSVEAKTVTAGDKNITVTITYSPDKQKAKVVFIDDTTKKTLDTHDLTGVTNGHEKYSPSEEIEKFIHDNYVFVSSDYPEKGFTYDNDDSKDQVFEVHLKEVPIESDTPIIPDNTEDNGGSNDTPTDSNNPEKDNGGLDTDKSNHKTPVKRHENKKHHGTKKTSIQKNVNKNHQSTKTTNIPKTSKTAKLNPNRLAQPKLEKVQESTNSVNRIKHDALPQTGEKRSSLMAMLGLAISGLGMIGAMKSKKRKDD